MVLNRLRASASSRIVLLSILVFLLSACDAQISVSCGDTVVDSNVGAPSLVGDSSGDVAYELRLSERQQVTISTCEPETNFDTRLRLFEDRFFFNEIAQDDDGGSGNCLDTTSEISETLSSGTYYIVVEGFLSNEGIFEMRVECSDTTDLTLIIGAVAGSLFFCCCFCGLIVWCARASGRSKNSSSRRRNPPQQQRAAQRLYARQEGQQQPQPIYVGQPQPIYAGQPRPVYSQQPQAVYTGQPQQSQPGGIAMRPVVSMQPMQNTFTSNTQPGAASYQPASNPNYLPEPDDPPPAYDDFHTEKP